MTTRVHAEELQRVERRREGVGIAGEAGHDEARVTHPGEHLGKVRLGFGEGLAVAGQRRHDDDEQRVALGLGRDLFEVCVSSLLPAVWLATTSVVSLTGALSSSMSLMTCWTAIPEASATRSTRSRRSQPDAVAGSVEITISSGLRSAIASIVAWNGSESPTSPVASKPSSSSTDSARSSRTWAASRTDWT